MAEANKIPTKENYKSQPEICFCSEKYSVKLGFLLPVLESKIFFSFLLLLDHLFALFFIQQGSLFLAKHWVARRPTQTGFGPFWETFLPIDVDTHMHVSAFLFLFRAVRGCYTASQRCHSFWDSELVLYPWFHFGRWKLLRQWVMCVIHHSHHESLSHPSVTAPLSLIPRRHAGPRNPYSRLPFRNSLEEIELLRYGWAEDSKCSHSMTHTQKNSICFLISLLSDLLNVTFWIELKRTADFVCAFWEQWWQSWWESTKICENVGNQVAFSNSHSKCCKGFWSMSSKQRECYQQQKRFVCMLIWSLSGHLLAISKGHLVIWTAHLSWSLLVKPNTWNVYKDNFIHVALTNAGVGFFFLQISS